MSNVIRMNITDAARVVGRHVNTLREWEREGLIKPERIAGARMYTADDIERLKAIAKRKAAAHAAGPAARRKHGDRD